LVRSQLMSFEFFIDIKSFRSNFGPAVDSVSNRNEYQEHFLGGKGGRCVRLTTLPPSCAFVMKSGNLNFVQPSGPLQSCNRIALPLNEVTWLFLYWVDSTDGSSQVSWGWTDAGTPDILSPEHRNIQFRTLAQSTFFPQRTGRLYYVCVYMRKVGLCTSRNRFKWEII